MINYCERHRFFSYLLYILFAFSVSACNREPKIVKGIEYYPVPNRRFPPPKVYSRLTWSHLPHPIPARPLNQAPLFSPEISFELPNSTLGESIESLAQAIGFRWSYPKKFAERPVSINMVGTVGDILNEIEKQANVKGVFDFDERILLIIDQKHSPKL